MKLSLRQDLLVNCPTPCRNPFEGTIQKMADELTNARITQYQALLLDPLRFTFTKTEALNSNTLLPDPDLGS